MTTKAKVITGISTAIVIGLAIYIYFHFFFVYKTGVNAGTINYFQREGIIFKTYEGKMIQSGFSTAKGSSTGLTSNEFRFSVANQAVADSLMRSSGKQVELSWRYYFGTLPWRGNSQYVVDKIVSTSPAQPETVIPVVTE